jgi:hypothetical protein
MGRSRWWMLGCVVWLSCSSDETGGNAPCVGDDDRCGTTCSPMQPCTSGLYCTEAGACAKDCDLDNPCPGGGMCAPNGTCRGGSGDGGTSSGGSGSGPGGGPRPGSCADTVVEASPTTPTVILIVDQSSSMEEDFDDGSRWDVLRDFMLEEPDGLIADLQQQVHFGLAMYSAVSGGMSPDPIGECPMVTTVAPAANNYAAIAEAYGDAEPIEDTPTGDAIDRIIDDFGFNDPDDEANPIVFVLATDGEPDRCEELDPQNGQAEAIAAVERAHSLGIRTFIISVGEGEISADHQQDVANAGLGREPGDADAEFWVAGDDQTLRAALTSIVGGQLGCEISLNGEVEGDACLGSVELNGTPLDCDDDDGWELVDARHIRLLGDACDELKAGGDVHLDVSFPCGVVSVD